ncbi:nuclear transport factor 2 family protein [Hymenobacter crusticola]|uniref:SnoaL-like domain-containing protein n=1 Tax=Hymenobacter crusticola TaxID=1770526 RepID=A0A243WA64_9BACT|nr:nuclear transport factor 2 family protein [Hymenobacter crusticola]OUJ72454.1 hypothetical protein BXP70_17995 [Hymenobacter crusticola]
MQATIEAYLAAYNAKDIPAMLALLDEQIVFENVSNTSGVITTSTKQEFAALARQSVDYFAERRQIVRFAVMGAGAAAVEIDYQATLAQDLPNGLKAGEQLKLRGVSVFEWRDGKFTRISDYS